MANKKILVSDGNGRYQETSAFIDNNNVLSASINALTASFNNTAISGVMQVSGNQLIPLWITSSILAYSKNENDVDIVPADLSGCLFQFRIDETAGLYKGFAPHRISSASFSGDIVGTLSSSQPIRVISVGNVNSGTLDSKFGGTSTSSFNVDSLITLSGSGIRPDGTNNDKIIVATSNNAWTTENLSYTNFTPLTSSIVYLFTGSMNQDQTVPYLASRSGSVTNYLWKKPDGCRFIKVICQGAGGAGSSGLNGAGPPTTGGSGGGGGGYSVAVFDSINFPTTEITISAGNCGKRYPFSGFADSGSGGNGGSSSFGSYLYANGGLGGYGAGSGATFDGGDCGAGYTYGINFSAGAEGGDGNTAAIGTTGSNMLLGGAGGGGGGGSTFNGGKGGNITSLSLIGGSGGTGSAGDKGKAPMSGNIFNFNQYYLNNTSSITIGNFPYLIYGGGGGGKGSTTTGRGDGWPVTGTTPNFFGSGGGGGGYGTSATTCGKGGCGGAGYVLIICT